MTIYSLFDVVVVPFPFSDLIRSKKRKALVLSNQVFQKGTGNLTLGMITSASASSWPGDYPILNLEPAGLNKSCYFRCKFFSLDQNLILEKVGRLGPADQKGIIRSLKTHFGLI